MGHRRHKNKSYRNTVNRYFNLFRLLVHQKQQIDKRSTIVSDFWKGYSGLVDVGYGRHIRLNHKKGEWVDKKGNHINGIENFWSFSKIRLNKV